MGLPHSTKCVPLKIMRKSLNNCVNHAPELIDKVTVPAPYFDLSRLVFSCRNRAKVLSMT